ncbi:MAG: PQQ-binding-like beta-propeller repeat protein [Patescibacteria group bacterium]
MIAFEIDDPIRIKNSDITTNCKGNKSKESSCILFIDATTGKLKNSAEFEGRIYRLLDSEDYIYSKFHDERLKDYSIKDSNYLLKLGKINKDTLQNRYFVNKEISNPYLESGSEKNDLEVVDNYVVMINEQPIENALNMLPRNKVSSLVIQDTTDGSLYKYPKELFGTVDKVIIGDNDTLKVYVKLNNKAGVTETIFDVKKERIVSERQLSDFESYQLEPTTTVSPDDNVVYYVEKDAQIAARTKEGNVLWTRNLRTQADIPGQTYPGIDDKLYVDDTKVYAATQEQQFYALNKETGEIMWVLELPTSIGKDFVVYKNKAYFATFGNVLAHSGLGIIDLEKAKLIHLEKPKGASPYWMEFPPILSPPYIYFRNDYGGIYKFRLLD